MATKRTVKQSLDQLDLCEARLEIALARARTAEQRASIEAFKAFYARRKQSLQIAQAQLRRS